jgi:hypothetical protein
MPSGKEAVIASSRNAKALAEQIRSEGRSPTERELARLESAAELSETFYVDEQIKNLDEAIGAPAQNQVAASGNDGGGPGDVLIK